MTSSLSGGKAALLVANGFEESQMIEAQKALQKQGISSRIVAMGQGLVNGWTGQGWGLHFAADQSLSQSLAADYDLLIVPGGTRHIEKLKLTEHTRRFVSGFVDQGKPVALCDEALDLLLHLGRAAGARVATPASIADTLQAAGAICADEKIVADENVITADLKDDLHGAMADLVLTLKAKLDEPAVLKKAA